MKPAQYPNLYMTQISGGATQADYVLPRVISTELKRQCVKFKLVGNLVHGHAIIFSSGLPAQLRQVQFGEPTAVTPRAMRPRKFALERVRQRTFRRTGDSRSTVSVLSGDRRRLRTTRTSMSSARSVLPPI